MQFPSRVEVYNMPSVAGAGRHDSDHDMYVDKVLIIVAATIGASLLLAAISLAVTWYMRRRNRARMVELEDEEPIELQGLPPRPLESREDVYRKCYFLSLVTIFQARISGLKLYRSLTPSCNFFRMRCLANILNRIRQSRVFNPSFTKTADLQREDNGFGL